MRIENQRLLALFREPGRCEWCGKSCQVREPHHVRCTGMGGGKRLDVAINLLAVGSTAAWECPCHVQIQGQKKLEPVVLEIIAAREKTTVDEITEVLDLFARLPKGTTEEKLKEGGLLKWVKGGFGCQNLGESGIGYQMSLLNGERNLKNGPSPWIPF